MDNLKSHIKAMKNELSNANLTPKDVSDEAVRQGYMENHIAENFLYEIERLERGEGLHSGRMFLCNAPIFFCVAERINHEETQGYGNHNLKKYISECGPQTAGSFLDITKLK